MKHLLATTMLLSILSFPVLANSQTVRILSTVVLYDGGDPDNVWSDTLLGPQPSRVVGLHGWACEAERTPAGAVLWCVAGSPRRVGRLSGPGSLMVSVDCRTSRENFVSVALSNGRWRGVVSLTCSQLR